METLEEYMCPFIISLKFDLLMTGGEMQVSLHEFGNLKKKNKMRHYIGRNKYLQSSAKLTLTVEGRLLVAREQSWQDLTHE
jgi:hypothetical protein